MTQGQLERECLHKGKKVHKLRFTAYEQHDSELLFSSLSLNFFCKTGIKK